MDGYTITIELPDREEIKQIVNESVFPKVAHAIRMIAEIGREDWVKAVDNARLWSGEKVPYKESIKVIMHTAMSATIISDYKYASDIETGRPAYDMKQMLNTSDKVRTSKTGKRYLIIPFRHGTPDSNTNPMPASVYKSAKNLAPSSVVSIGQRRSGHGAMNIKTRSPIMVEHRQYAWGDSMPKMKVKGDRHAGMVRFDTSSKKANSSTYMTFRVMMEGSSGWIRTAQPGKFIAKKVADDLQPVADRVIAEAFNLS
jgi:hypothetical protein